ncbi:hypothetical protein ACHAPQ_001006 [Fusarium lateritium]
MKDEVDRELYVTLTGTANQDQLTPGDAELIARLKEHWDEHSDVWDHETKESLVRYISQGDTGITKTNGEQPSGHKLWRTPISFAIWIIFRVQYGHRKLSLMKSRLVERFPGIDLSSWKSPGFKKPRVKCPLVGRKDPPATQNQSKDDGDLGLNANPFTELVGHDDDEEDPHMSDFSDSELEGSDQDEDENDTPVHSRIQQAFAFSSRKRSGSSSSHRQKAKQPRTSSSPPPSLPFPQLLGQLLGQLRVSAAASEIPLLLPELLVGNDLSPAWSACGKDKQTDEAPVLRPERFLVN